MKNEIKDLLSDVKNYVEYQKVMGQLEFPRLRPTETREGTEALPYKENQKALDKIKEEIGSNCQRCKLGKTRTNLVFGVGSPCAELMFVGEAPGADEDEQGIPFVGRAGQLLTKIIQAMGMKREDVYIANICKSRPPNNRNPEPDEIAACMPFLIKQINIIKPKIIVALGAVAAKAMMQTETPISKMRGKLLDWPPVSFKTGMVSFLDASKPEEQIHQCKLLPTFHPAFLLRNPNMKKPVWEDMQKVMEILKS